MTITDEVLLDRPVPGIGLVTLNRPESLNAFTGEMLAGLESVFDELEHDPTIRVIVLTGAGRAFCSGVDLKGRGADAWLADRDPTEGRVEWAELVTHTLMRLRRSSRPVIAAVNGPAAGGGLALALLADLRVAAESAYFANGFIANGLSGCELGASYLLPRLIGVGLANELMLTGRRVPVEEAARIGLVNKAVPDDQLLESAYELAGQIMQWSPTAVTFTKQVATANQDAGSLEQAMLLEMRTQMLAVHTADSREARTAFLEKRPPRYTGSRLQ